MLFYDIELMDKDSEIENFKYLKVSKEDLDKIISVFKNPKKCDFLEFTYQDEIYTVLEKSFFRGVTYTQHTDNKTIVEENIDAAKTISRVKLKRPLKKEK